MTTRRNLHLITFALALLVTVSLTACSPPSSTGASALTGKAAPAFTLDLLDGGTLDLAQHAGKNVVILDFWATWCPPCRKAMPVLAEVASDFSDQGVKLYAVNLREDSDTIRAFLDQSGLDIEVALDREGSVAELFGVQGIPQTVVIDTAGAIADIHVGFSPGLKQELSKVLNGLVGS